ncbi:MAG TPA: RNA polymerase subunit sigma [Candidatus Cloacimonas sp.]|nr:RNA polymerase subunit sigma [Candidatus Cloacimonas sp.]
MSENVFQDKALQSYLKDIADIQPLSREEEQKLARRAKAGDKKAEEKLVLHNLKFVVKIAARYQNRGLSLSELISEGNVGLIKAIHKFEPDKHNKLISYAVWWIRQSIMQAISNQNRIVRLPINRLSSINKITGAIPYLEQKLEREPTDAELANYLDLSKDDVKIANHIKNRQASFDKPISNDSDSEFSLYDMVETDNIPSPDDHLLQESLTTNISRALNKLTRREAEIITMSFGLFDSPVYSLHDMATIYKMSSERIRQIRRRGLIRLKSLLKGKVAFLD